MISSLSFFTGLLPFRESVGLEAILDSGVTSTPTNSSIEGSPLNVSGSERLERLGTPLEHDAPRSGHSSCFRRLVICFTISLMSTKTLSNFSE
jgi:hypothetical protein